MTLLVEILSRSQSNGKKVKKITDKERYQENKQKTDTKSKTMTIFSKNFKRSNWEKISQNQTNFAFLVHLYIWLHTK